MIDRAYVTEVLNRIDEARWDRCVEVPPTTLVAYGWVDRADDHEDFVVLFFEETEHGTLVSYTTSSAELSPVIAERLFGAAGEHNECQRIETEFPEVENAIRLEAA